jgi:hypothetical protein
MIDRLQNNAMTTSADAQDAGNHQSDGLQGASATARQTGAEKAEGDRRQLPEADQRQFQKLKQRDRDVRAHEQAPITADAGIVREKVQIEKAERQEAENKDEAQVSGSMPGRRRPDSADAVGLTLTIDV